MLEESEKIYVDASTPRAALVDQDNTMQCPTLGEAVMEWHRPPKDRKRAATVKVFGRVYSAHEIGRMHYGPKP
jgi:precorrin-6x reductase